MPAMGRFDGRHALVTGASSGIGRACALALVQEGATVSVTGRDEARLREAREASSSPERVRLDPADLSDPTEARRIVDEAIAAAGAVEILINAAGIALDAGVLDIDAAHWRSTFALNLDASFWVAQAVARHMVERGVGAIVNVASIDGLVPEAPLAAYDASKASLISLTRSFAHELGHLGVRCNAVAPGMTMTPMIEAETARFDFVEGYLPRIPQRRFARADEVAAAILFLASDDASYVNGTTLVVDGGQLAGSWYYPWDAPLTGGEG
jgi:meso-butanediol dehydrogenase/(S,S)-butanediol dehydrogenase/diacetyl reductase